MNKKVLKRIIVFALVVPVVLSGSLIAFMVWKQDSIVRQLISTANTDFTGELLIADSHISPFVNFPYVSIDLDHV